MSILESQVSSTREKINFQILHNGKIVESKIRCNSNGRKRCSKESMNMETPVTVSSFKWKLLELVFISGDR